MIFLLPSITLVLASWSLCSQAFNILRAATCDTVDEGYQCRPQISHFWGHYSPYFAVPTEISADVPKGCEITFVNVLARHAARFPITNTSASFNLTIRKIQSTTKNFKGKYAFLADYVYPLGAENLTVFGEQESYNLGIQFFRRYTKLLQKYTPFIRAAGIPRIVRTAANFSAALHQERITKYGRDPASYPYPIQALSEAAGSNDTLDPTTCTAFRTKAPYNVTQDEAQKTWAGIFVPPIAARLNAALAPTVLNITETLYVMDLCPFSTVANPGGAISPFCDLFTVEEWHQYSYYQTLGKYYGYGAGNALGPTQGVGFVNELIARLTNSPVYDATTTNQILDSNPATFPVGPKYPVFADFSRDITMTAIFFAMNFYSDLPPLSNTTIEEVDKTNGYSTPWTVPFTARAYFEKMVCKGEKEELVRAVINNRVVPLQKCGADSKGRCGLKAFVKSLDFARRGGKWADCFK